MRSSVRESLPATRWAMWCVMAALALLAATPGAVAQQTAALTSDAADYAPGETAILTGSGFLPGEPIDLSIAIDDPATGTHIGDYAWTVFFADDDGGFVATYVVPAEAQGMNLQATAMGLSSGRIAVVQFTDSHGTYNFNFATSGLPAGASVTVTGSRTNPGHHVASYSVTFSAPGPSSNIGAQAGGGTSTVSFSFPSPLVVSGTTYNFDSASKPSGFLTGASGTTETITGTYVPACPANSNAAPTLAVNNLNLGSVLTFTGEHVVTVTPADFGSASDPDGDLFSFTFDDGSTSKNVALSIAEPSMVLTLKAVDSPPALRGGCPASSLTTTASVTVSAAVVICPSNSAPVVAASVPVLDLGHIGLESGTDVIVPVSPEDFGASATDPDGDGVSFSLSSSSVALSLAEGLSDGDAEVVVYLTATDDPSPRDVALCALAFGPLASSTSSIPVKVRATLHRNHAPMVSANDKDLGLVIGCLAGGSFAKTIPVDVGFFNGGATDPDGDPIDLTIDGSSATLVGPGLASATFTITATDDPSVRTFGTVAPKSMSMEVTVSARVGYNFLGYGSPLNGSTNTVVKRGSTIPVKFQICDCNGTQIATGTHTIAVYYNSGSAPNTNPTVDDSGTSGDNGSAFRWSAPNWIFNLKTNNSYALDSTYKIRATLADGTTRDVYFSVKR